MANTAWREEIRQSAAKWPRVFRAYLSGGQWELLGCSRAVRDEFLRAAQRIQREEAFPVGDTDAVTALLYRLKENGHHVRSIDKRVRRPAGFAGIETRATIYPIRNALIRYLNEEPGRHGYRRPRRVSASNGQAEAAQKNRIHAVRLSILEAFQRSGQPVVQWPDVVRKFQKELAGISTFHQTFSPATFQPPDFDRLQQTAAEWSAEADRQWRQHRDRSLDGCQHWVAEGVDDEIPAAKPTRRAGSSQAKGLGGANTALDQRTQWAMQYLNGVPLKEIAAQSSAEASTVGRVARTVLKQAGWLEYRRLRRGSGGAGLQTGPAVPGLPS